MLPDRVSNPGPLTYESGALPIALRGPALIAKLDSTGIDPCTLSSIKFFTEGRKENPQKPTQLSSRSHPRHLVGKRTAQKTPS